MTIVILCVLLIVGFELLWRAPPLYPHRWHFRAMLAVFWIVVLTIFAADRLSLAPGFYFDGVPRFASDAVTYQNQARALTNALRDGAFADFSGDQFFHYSRVLAVLYLLFGEQPLIGNIFNAVFYLSSLISIFLIGRQLFGDRAGLIATWLFALTPTFLLHDTQTLRWAMTTAGLHLAACGTLVLLGNRRSWAGLLVAGIGFGILVYDLPHIARVFILCVASSGFLALAPRLPWRLKLLTAGRVCGFALIAAVWYQVSWAPKTFQEHAAPQAAVPESPTVDSTEHADTPASVGVGAHLDTLIAPVLSGRTGFVQETESLQRDGNSVGTALTGPSLVTFADFVRNLPTAYGVALIEPTIPRLLDRTDGSSGVGRFAAIEMVVYYVITALAFVGLLVGLRLKGLLRLQVVFVVILLAGVYALIGTTVMNGGTLHRLRQPYVAFHCVFAAGALAWGCNRRGARGLTLEPYRKGSVGASQ